MTKFHRTILRFHEAVLPSTQLYACSRALLWIHRSGTLSTRSRSSTRLGLCRRFWICGAKPFRILALVSYWSSRKEGRWGRVLPAKHSRQRLSNSCNPSLSTRYPFRLVCTQGSRGWARTRGRRCRVGMISGQPCFQPRVLESLSQFRMLHTLSLMRRMRWNQCDLRRLMLSMLFTSYTRMITWALSISESVFWSSSREARVIVQCSSILQEESRSTVDVLMGSM